MTARVCEVLINTVMGAKLRGGGRVGKNWPVRIVRPPAWEFHTASQVSRTLVEFTGTHKDYRKDPLAHRDLARLIEYRAPNIKAIVNRGAGGPFGAALETFRNKGAQFRAQGLIQDLNNTLTIEPTEFGVRLGVGLVTEQEYWEEALFGLVLGPPRTPQWQGPKFPIVERILNLAQLLSPKGGLTPQAFVYAYYGFEDSGIDEACERAMDFLNHDSEEPPSKDIKAMVRGIREIMKSMAKYKPRGGDAYGAGWLKKENEFYYITNIGEELLAGESSFS